MARSTVRRCRSRSSYSRRVLAEALERRDLLASYTTPEDSQLVVTDEAFVAAQIVSQPLHGTLSLTSVGGFAYKPNLNYHGPDRFTYFVATDPPTTNIPPGAIVEVPITVTPVNDAPEARAEEKHECQPHAIRVAGPPPFPANRQAKHDTGGGRECAASSQV